MVDWVDWLALGRIVVRVSRDGPPFGWTVTLDAALVDGGSGDAVSFDEAQTAALGVAAPLETLVELQMTLP